MDSTKTKLPQVKETFIYHAKRIKVQTAKTTCQKMNNCTAFKDYFDALHPIVSI
jgi:hypothetical protein